MKLLFLAIFFLCMPSVWPITPATNNETVIYWRAP